MKSGMTFGLIAGAVVVVVGTALPMMAKERGAFPFETMDINKDGFLDKAELAAARDARFAEIDADGDGAVSGEEIAAYRTKMHASHGGDRKKAAFAALDTDGDGSISQAEFEAGADKRMKRHHKRSQWRQGRMMAHLDANKDGKITKDELGDHMGERILKHADADGDGRISKAEADAMRSKGRKHSE